MEGCLLTKEEVPIVSGRMTIIPIHSRLLGARLDRTLAHKVFPKAVEDWHKDLQLSLDAIPEEGLEDGTTKRDLQESYLTNPPVLEKMYPGADYERYQIAGMGWSDDVHTAPNGFATGLSINRDIGGTLFLPGASEHIYIGPPFVNFSEEKEKLYKGARAYSQHNVDFFAGALLLRDWALLYLNAALKTLR